MLRATGTFQVNMTPLPSDADKEGVTTLGRMSLNKQFQGDLDAVGIGEMLTAITETEGSAGYVAIERIRGTLHGRRGSFVVQHNGISNRNTQNLTITVVPDSGADELSGLSGTMSIHIVDGKHFYELLYSLNGQDR